MSKWSHSWVVLALCLASSAHAGNLEVKRHGATLKLRGDDDGVRFTLQGVPLQIGLVSGLVRVVAGARTTVNGLPDELEFEGISNVSITLGDASHGVVLHSLDVGAISIQGAPTSQAVAVVDSRVKSLTVDAGKGTLGFQCFESFIRDRLRLTSRAKDDYVQLRCMVQGDVQMNLGEGTNVALLEAGTYARSVTVRMGNGDDRFQLDDAEVQKHVKVELGDGENRCGFNRSGVGGSVTCRGGKGADAASVSELRVFGNLAFALAGGSNSATLQQSDVYGALVYEGGPGDEWLALEGVEAVLGATFKLGNGNNTFDMAGGALSQARKLVYAGGSGADSLNLNDLVVDGPASYQLGAGANRLIMNEVRIGKSLGISSGNDDDWVRLEFGVEIGDDATLSLGNGDNRVEVAEQAVVADRLAVTAGAGDDSVAFDGTQRLGRTSFRLGAGANALPR